MYKADDLPLNPANDILTSECAHLTDLNTASTCILGEIHLESKSDIFYSTAQCFVILNEVHN